jgi:hypothetical protein
MPLAIASAILQMGGNESPVFEIMYHKYDRALARLFLPERKYRSGMKETLYWDTLWTDGLPGLSLRCSKRSAMMGIRRRGSA